MLVKRAMLHCGGGLRKKRCTAGVRDGETERGDRKSLTLNPCLPLPRPASHPQHSGLSPPAWVTSPIFLYLEISLLWFLTLPCPSFRSLSFAALILSVTHSLYASDWESIPNMCPLISSFPSLLSLPAIVLLLHSFQSCLFLYPCVLCRHTPTWLSFTSVFFKDSLSLPLCLCSLPALCLCVISSLAVVHNAPRSHLPSHVRVEHKQAAVWIKHLRQCTHWAPLECRDEHWFWDRGLWPHTVSVCQCVLLSAWHCIPLSSEGYRMFGFFMIYGQRKEGTRTFRPPRSLFLAFPGSRHILYFCTCLIFCLFCFKLFISLFFIFSLSMLILHSPFFLCFWSLHFILLLSLIHTSPSLPLNPSTTTTTTTTPSLSCSHWSCQYDGYKNFQSDWWLLIAARISLGCQRDTCTVSLCVSLSLHMSVSARKDFRVFFMSMSYLQKAVHSGKWASGESLPSPPKLAKPSYHPVLCVDSVEIKLTFGRLPFQQSHFIGVYLARFATATLQRQDSHWLH